MLIMTGLLCTCCGKKESVSEVKVEVTDSAQLLNMVWRNLMKVRNLLQWVVISTIWSMETEVFLMWKIPRILRICFIFRQKNVYD